ncbi:uncharacterized protein LOC141689871 [Apium graveolens]|uniref:uncharacterized protein LOC141689871 n=1 Tax=Apium graveolens TaxID=4045 RepID=UPI003D7A0165
MAKFGFIGVWIDRIMQFISSVSYSFLHNGEESSCVFPERGLRLGDPILPYIYIMCVEGLSAIIRRDEEAELIHGCQITRGAPKDRQEVQEQLQVRENENPRNYLGLPMRVGQNKKAVFGFLVERVSSKLQAWGMGNISKAGKVTLLKSTAQTIPTFWMNLLLISSDVCDRIEKKMNSYWWGGRWEHVKFDGLAGNGYVFRCNCQWTDDGGAKEMDIEVLHDICNECDRNLIHQIHVPSRNIMDFWYWLLDDKGELSVKSCYRQLRGERESHDRGFWNILWSLNRPGKIVNFLWRVEDTNIPSGSSSRSRREMINVPIINSVQVEDTIHMMFSCCFARDLWSMVGLKEVVRVEEGMKGLQNMSVFGVRSMALNLMREWKNINEGGVGDVASQGNTENIGVACVARDDSGRFLGARSSNCRGYTQV